MKPAATSVFDILSRLRVNFQGEKANKNEDYEEPMRSELYSSDQMDRHGQVVAGSQKLLLKKSPDQLLKRLGDNEKTLLEVRNLLVENIKAGKTITPGAEWLLDNFYLIEEQVVIARKHLPKGYSEGLPLLAEGISAGMPRVYDIVLEIISHSDGRVDVKGLRSFITAYQTVTVLTLGELWAIPIMLRLAVIENLRRVCRKIALDMVDHNLADFWADKMMTTVKDEPENLILTIADMARSKPVLVSPFVAGFTRKLQGKGPALALPLSWMEQQLSVGGISSNDLVRQENQKQAADQVSVRNSIGTLRFLGATDWRDFVEALSSVEHILRQDAAGTYPLMDFATRDRYRHVVEGISKASQLSESEVAGIVLRLSEQHQSDDQKLNRREHVGYYLIDRGLKETERLAGRNYTLRKKLIQVVKRAPVFIYLLSIVTVTGALAGLMFYMANKEGVTNGYLLALIGLLSVSGAGQLAVSLVNWFSTIWVKPKLLPRLDFSEGIPGECRTLVIIPTLISSKSYIEELVEALEIRFLANMESNLHYGLLTDFLDSDTETKPEDLELLHYAGEMIEGLNRQYSGQEEDIFFLFHRPRSWNERERKWMGYERKRGKLSALNAFVRGRGKGDFSKVVGRTQVLRQVKYVITLDSDTQLPRDAVWKFVATMAHPLNQAVYDEGKKRVTEGYGILQPRLAWSMPTKAVSLYLRMQGDVSGIDPYTRVSSDVYQDLFKEGSFIGKGIYEVDVFEKALDHVFQENRILSHDLLEGCYTRSGLISDVLLYEENPSVYVADVKRHHRWIRGDWQIGAWMLPFVTGGNGRLTRNKLSALSRWKIFDNIRRSLLPLSLTMILILGWSVLLFPWFWTLAVTFIILLPVLTAAGWQLVNKPKDLNFGAHFFEVGLSVRDILIRFMFGIAVLPFEAYKYTDAVLRTNWRMIVSGRKLLEWTPSAAVSKISANDFWSSYRLMWIAPFLALLCSVFLAYSNPIALLVASPMLLLWLVAPALAWRLSTPEQDEGLDLPEEQILFLHKTARKTWTYFEQFVTETENWMPPDNFQEEPAPVIAHRTSPTNLGLALLANLTAYDFGYIGGKELLSRSNNALQSMLSLERYQGHFYNWYDTLTLLPMQPRYVSTVDSGNLVGHLLTLKQGLLALPNTPIFNENIFQGFRTTASILLEFPEGDHTKVIGEMLALLNETDENPNSAVFVKSKLDRFALLTGELLLLDSTDLAVRRWSEKLSMQLKNIEEDLFASIPWLSILPVPAYFGELSFLDQCPTLIEVRGLHESCTKLINRYIGEADPDQLLWLSTLQDLIRKGSELATEGIILIDQMADQCEEMSTVSYDFLFDKSTSLLRIGYNVDEQRKDDSFYDLLASEARLGIFAGIAQGKLPQESWFALGRLLTNSGGNPILLSWSGSMFEYLMPQLVMPSYENTLLYQTNKATVKRQIEYGLQREIPWGISESAYNTVDASMNYQYRAFGVPGLGLKRGLEEDLVIAPYASMLALMVAPAKACANLELLSEEGFEGEYGFYEAIDYTPSRLPRGKSSSILHSFMVHHQGMGFLSLSYLLLNKPMQQRFVSELRFQATLLLLQERVPRATLFYAHTADLIETKTTISDSQIRIIPTANTVMPEIQLLSNGRYQVMVTNSGGGYSRWKDIAVTRWREDTTADNTGIFCYIKDVDSGKFWSNTHHPTLKLASGYEAIFSIGHAEFGRHDHEIDTKTEIVISPEDDTEMRRLRITNKSLSIKTLEITSYAEIVLASQASDESHPAFSNLFVQTEIIQEYNAVFCTRRARSKDETPPWMFHMMDVHGTVAERVSYETDRMRFIGRRKTLVHPQAMDDEVLSGNQGSVLDPIVSIRRRITIKPNQTATVDLIYGVSETRADCENLMHKYRDRHLKKRAFELSWTHSQVLLRQINVSETDAQLYDKLAASVIYSNAALRAETSVIAGNFRGQSGLWSHSVSGDLPIVLLHIYDPESVELVRQLVQAHAYWQLKGLAVDLVIWNEDYGSYRQVLQDQILGLIASEAGNNVQYSKPGKIFVKSADQISAEDRQLFESVARVIIHDNKGTLSEQVNRHVPEKAVPPALVSRPIMVANIPSTLTMPDNLLFNNETGGFTSNGKEYKILTDRNKTTPAPWVNVIANPDFGTVVSESGSAYTWAVNAHEYRLTPWSNDPVSDLGGEAFYLRDEETGDFWSPSPFPVTGATPYITTHGFGYTSFEHSEQGIFSEMSISVDKDSPVKFVVIKIRNQSGRVRKFSATGFLQMILGDVHSKTNMHVISERDIETGALLVRNRYNTAFAERVMFFHVEGSHQSFTGDRSEFIGRNRSLKDPQVMYRKKLSGRSGAGLDPCAALQVRFDLLDGGEKEMVFLMGSGENTFAAQMLVRKFTDKEAISTALQDVKQYWKEVVEKVQITTPDLSLNVLANGWLTYQTMACRIFARSGFYQSGGAFGFRDQLQDVLALLHSSPELAREQILLSASRQFTEGDVQHWWHPPEGRGVRTHCSDDLLWLPFAVSRYVAATGDKAILKTPLGFLESRLLHAGEDSFYDLPVSGGATDTLYNHCARAITHSLHFGEHGLPLIGSGDWNDGMDQVGNQGKGESVWLAFFLYDVLNRFVEVANVNGDSLFAFICKKESVNLKNKIEAHAWDGQWYKRAWFDDGSPLGSKENVECRIDAIAQSWSVLSGAADPARKVTAMDSLDKYLVKRDLKLIQLLDPPFNGAGPNPGYIQGYVPGVRENGGQYSHAAIWALMGFAVLGEREKVYELFSMINPLNRSSDPAAIQTYKVEPYVMAADVYANESHQGRGGWTWYTGSAGWMYQFITGSLLGMELKSNKLIFKPCFPLDWPSVSIVYQYGSSVYRITVFQLKDASGSWWKTGGEQSEGNEVSLIDDGAEHWIEMYLGAAEVVLSV